MGYMALMFVVCTCFVSQFVFNFYLPGVPTYLKNEEDLGNSIVKTVSRAAPAPANVSLGDLQGRPLFVFGDSTVDAGNFNITKRPYGVDYHTLGPRFSNGLTIADYLGKTEFLLYFDRGFRTGEVVFSILLQSLLTCYSQVYHISTAICMYTPGFVLEGFQVFVYRYLNFCCVFYISVLVFT